MLFFDVISSVGCFDLIDAEAVFRDRLKNRKNRKLIAQEGKIVKEREKERRMCVKEEERLVMLLARKQKAD